MRTPCLVRSSRDQRGFTLIEVLVAFVVLSVGLLGLAGMQTLSLRSNHSAFLRSQATMLVGDIVDRMRANRTAAVGGDYDIAYTDSVATTVCTSGCTPTALAEQDLREWRSYVERLPGGGSDVVVDLANGRAQIKVSWRDSRNAVTGSALSCERTADGKRELCTNTVL